MILKDETLWKRHTSNLYHNKKIKSKEVKEVCMLDLLANKLLAKMVIFLKRYQYHNSSCVTNLLFVGVVTQPIPDSFFYSHRQHKDTFIRKYDLEHFISLLDKQNRHHKQKTKTKWILFLCLTPNSWWGSLYFSLFLSFIPFACNNRHYETK